MANSAKRAIAVSATIAMILFSTGCGGSSKPSTAPDTPEQIKNDKAIAKTAVLKLSDLPTGYKGTPHVDNPSSDTPKPVLQKFATCADIPEAEAAELVNGTDDPSDAIANSPLFDQNDAETGHSAQLENSVTIVRSSDEISDTFDYFATEETLPCWEDLFRAGYKKDLDPGDSVRNLAVTTIDTGEIADKSAGLGVQGEVVGPAGSVMVYFDIYIAGTGRAGISLTAVGIGERVDTELALSLLKTVADRLEGTT
jgi:hypothetical protein